MKKIILSSIAVFFVTVSLAFAKDAIYQYPANIKNVQIPQHKVVACKFNQVKTIPNSNAYIKSGGDFKFNIEHGVVFNTLYPVKATTSYTSEQNKRVSDIITAISKKDYSYINKNFDVYYMKNGSVWHLALKSKSSSKISNVMDSIFINGDNYINQISINTRKSGSTKINFTECR